MHASADRHALPLVFESCLVHCRMRASRSYRPCRICRGMPAMSTIPTSECLLGTGWYLMTFLPCVRLKALAVNFCGCNMSNGLPSTVTASASLMRCQVLRLGHGRLASAHAARGHAALQVLRVSEQQCPRAAFACLLAGRQCLTQISVKAACP